MTPPRLAPQAPLPVLVGACLLYMAVAETSATAFPGQGPSHLLNPASGFVLALLFIGGPRLLPGVLAGAILSQLGAGADPLAALTSTLGLACATMLAFQLLGRQPSFDREHPNFQVVRHVLLWACGMGAGAGALVASTGLLLVGHIGAAAWPGHVLKWWMGCALGFLLVAPLVMAYWRTLLHPLPLRRLDEGLVVWVLTGAAGTAIFGSPQNEVLDALANAYWMFLFVCWSGARLGMLPTMGLLCLVALQALWGSYQGTGFFAHDIEQTHGFGYWSYMMILAVAGLSLAAFMAERRRQTTALRIAATAFECQEGMLITDRQGGILQANLSFGRITGHAASEVLGRTPEFLCHVSSMQDCQFVPERNMHQRMQLVRKSGDTFPAWITVTPVRNAQEQTTHHVITLSDITSLQELELRRLEHERTQRNTLVREVHHRIKNNLQGIVGMLRTLDRQHPVLHEPINQMVDQIHSIATIHGLQGRNATEEVRLCELTRAVAEGISHNWSTPVTVDVPPQWLPCRIASQEAVPVALVLNELIVNAVKHGGHAQQDVLVNLRKGLSEDYVKISISNPGKWPEPGSMPPGTGRGLDLVAALIPRSGTSLTRSQVGARAVLQIDFSPPVIHAESSAHGT